MNEHIQPGDEIEMLQKARRFREVSKALGEYARTRGQPPVRFEVTNVVKSKYSCQVEMAWSDEEGRYATHLLEDGQPLGKSLYWSRYDRQGNERSEDVLVEEAVRRVCHGQISHWDFRFLGQVEVNTPTAVPVENSESSIGGQIEDVPESNDMTSMDPDNTKNALPHEQPVTAEPQQEKNGGQKKQKPPPNRRKTRTKKEIAEKKKKEEARSIDDMRTALRNAKEVLKTLSFRQREERGAVLRRISSEAINKKISAALLAAIIKQNPDLLMIRRMYQQTWMRPLEKKEFLDGIKKEVGRFQDASSRRLGSVGSLRNDILVGMVRQTAYALDVADELFDTEEVSQPFTDPEAMLVRPSTERSLDDYRAILFPGGAGTDEQFIERFVQPGYVVIDVGAGRTFIDKKSLARTAARYAQEKRFDFSMTNIDPIYDEQAQNRLGFIDRLSDPEIEEMRTERLNAEKEGVLFDGHSAQVLHQADESVDTYLSAFAFYQFRAETGAVGQALREAIRVLKPGAEARIHGLHPLQLMMPGIAYSLQIIEAHEMELDSTEHPLTFVLKKKENIPLEVQQTLIDESREWIRDHAGVEALQAWEEARMKK